MTSRTRLFSGDRVRAFVSSGSPGPALVLAGIAVVLVRIPFIWQTANPDISLYSVVGHGLLAGDALYVDVWDIKPPAIFLLYAAAEALVGQGPLQVFLLGSLGSLVVLAGIFVLVRTVDARAGLLAAVLWIPLSMNPAMEAQHANGELFVNAAVVWAVVMILRRRPLPAGLLLAAATLTKQNALLVPLALAVVLVVRREWRQPATWLAIGALAWAATLGWFGVTGRWDEVRYALFVWPAFYAGDPVANWLAGFFPQLLFQRRTVALLLAVAVAGHALSRNAEGRAAGSGRADSILWGYLVGAHAAWALPGEYFAHYGQLLVPPLLVLAAVGIARLRPRHVASVAQAGIVGLMVAIITWNALRPDRDESSPAFLDRQAAVADLRPGDDVSAIGNLPAAFVRTGSKPPGGYLHFRHFATGPRAADATRRVVADLADWRPEVILVDEVSVERWGPENAAVHWVRSNYSRVESGPGLTTVSIYRTSAVVD